MQESLDTIKRSCKKKTSEVALHALQSKQMSVHRMTDCLSKIHNKRGSVTSGIVLIPFYNLSKKTMQQGTGIDKRTAKLYSDQGNTELTKFIVIDEMTQCQVCKEHNAK